MSVHMSVCVSMCVYVVSCLTLNWPQILRMTSILNQFYVHQEMYARNYSNPYTPFTSCLEIRGGHSTIPPQKNPEKKLSRSRHLYPAYLHNPAVIIPPFSSRLLII